MSRRSLRLHTTSAHYDDSQLDGSLNHSNLVYSASYSVGGPRRTDAKGNKSRHAQRHSVSCSQSVLQTPHLQHLQQQHSQSVHNSSLHSLAASDASLLSSMLDSSCIQERTLVDRIWGLDEEAELSESSHLADHSTALANSTLLVYGDQQQQHHHHQTQTSLVNGSSCRDGPPRRDHKETLSHQAQYTPSSLTSAAPAAPSNATALSPPSTVYHREKSRTPKTAKTASDSCGWLWTGWGRLVTFMSVLIVFFLTRCLPKLKLLLCLLPLLVLYGLWWWGSSGLLSVLPAVNMTEWSSSFPLVLTSSLAAVYSSQSPVEGAIEHSIKEPAFESLPTKTAQRNGDLTAAAAAVDSERLQSLEHSLLRLWERVEGSGQKSEQQHAELVQLHQSLQQQLHSRTERASMEPWVAGMLEERLALLRREMEEEQAKREQTQDQYSSQQQSQSSRLTDLEILLQNLATKTEELLRRQEMVTTMPAVATRLPALVSEGVDRESHEALLAEVQRLETALNSVRHDLQGLTACQGPCERLGSVQDLVSARVRQQVWTLLYGSDPSSSEELQESLLEWLSERFVSGDDLQALLASLELRILQDVSLQLEQQRQSGGEMPCTQPVTQTALLTVGAAGATVTEEHVHLIVKNALRIYSQDRTGLVDYALETGGGSILSTRCSETYETKTALMSLFGLPLWYFSQSPRVVIQPDVYPGNCWAFKGSSGYLVIRLSMKIHPSAFSIEHIPKALAPSGTIISAPRHFTVYGLDDENQKDGKLLGNYTYEEDGEALQTYPVAEENDNSYQIIEVRVLSNWGHQKYTCLYRIRVHGKPCRD